MCAVVSTKGRGVDADLMIGTTDSPLLHSGTSESESFSEFFKDVDAPQLLKSVAAALGQSVDELKAFIYNLYYDPAVVFIYKVWGRYLAVGPLEKHAPEVQTRAGQ